MTWQREAIKARILWISIIGLLVQGCGGDKHFPSSNPPEYDPNKVHATQPAIQERVSDVRPRPTTESPTTQSSESRHTKPVNQSTSAAELARRVLAGGAHGRAALRDALSASGFAVIDSKRRVLSGVPQKPEMGIPLEDWEVTILARAAADQMTVPFSELETDIALAVKDERAGHLMTALLLDAIRAGVNDSIPTVRMWANLIIELGRQFAEPYDLLTVKDLAGVQLNGVQQVLMLKYLSAQFFALGIQHATDPSISRLSLLSLGKGSAMRLVADSEARAWRVSSLQPGDPCGFGTEEGIDTSIAASSWGWSLKFAFGPLRNLADEAGLIEAYRELSETTDLRSIYRRQELIRSGKEADALLNKYVKNLSIAHNIANALLSLAELTAVMNAVTIDITMDPSPPLVRTKTRQPGEFAKLAAALSFDLNKLDLPKQLELHCTGKFFMGLGLDFAMPENGPIKGADVEWTLIEGGLKMDTKAGYKVTDAIVELENPGPRIQDAGVGFRDVRKSVRTDDKGKAKTGIHGAPQKRELGRDPQPVIKQATARVNVQLKPADMFRDLADALKGPWVLPAQVLYRSHLLGKNYKFKVRDWTPRLMLEIRSTIAASERTGPDPAQSEATARIALHSPEEVEADTARKYTGEGLVAYKTGPPQNWNACMPLVRGEGTVGLRIFQAFIRHDEPESGKAGSELPPRIELLYGILGASQETSTGMHAMVNYKCVPNRPEPSPFWTSMFISGRGEVSTDPMVMFLLKDWTYVGQNGVVATKTLRSTCGGQCDQEVSVFTLKEQH
ncbi:MAG: hypothetical protein QM706_10930 [Nitrospira sp.]